MHNYVRRSILPQDQFCCHTGLLYSDHLECLSWCLYQDSFPSYWAWQCGPRPILGNIVFRCLQGKTKVCLPLSIIFSHIPANYSKYSSMYVFWSIQFWALWVCLFWILSKKIDLCCFTLWHADNSISPLECLPQTFLFQNNSKVWKYVVYCDAS